MVAVKTQNNSSDNEKFSIINGPSKFEFIGNSFLVNGKKRNETVFLLNKLKSHQLMRVIINSVSWKDGSGESWLFDGREVCGEKIIGGKIRGYYNTSRHTGHIEII